MTEEQNHTERNMQIKKLLDAIASYCPTREEMQSMEAAKLQMERNIEKKFYHSHANTNYKFPFVGNVASDYCDEDFIDLIQSDQPYVLKNQNHSPNQTKKSLSKQKSRPPLRQKSQNKLTLPLYTDKQQNESVKPKQADYSLVSNIHKVFKAKLKCQTPKVIKKQIILTNKKQIGERESLKSCNKQHQSNNLLSSSEHGESTGIKTKLKIKKPNNALNETKKIHLKTQNNVTFKNDNQCSIIRKPNEYQEEQQIQRPIYEQPSLEDSLFNNSRLNQNMDENPNFVCPSKGMFNVHELKEKLRDTSKSCKKGGIKRHKRTVTEGDTTSMIKIKLFSQSFRKQDFRQVDEEQKHNVSTHLFIKKTQTPYSNAMAERTVRSTLSQYSLKKGISVCGKIKQKDEKSQQKSKPKFGNRSDQKQLKLQRKNEDKQHTKCFQKSQIKNFTIMLKPSENKKKQLMESKSVRKQVSVQKGITLSTRKQNYETARISKINSIMNNLKQEYRNKNSSKTRSGIKTTICA